MGIVRGARWTPTGPSSRWYVSLSQLTQCEKMNHRFFFQVSNTDLSGLYDKLVEGLVPYNLWQGEIRRALNRGRGW